MVIMAEAAGEPGDASVLESVPPSFAVNRSSVSTEQMMGASSFSEALVILIRGSPVMGDAKCAEPLRINEL